ncbi:MAG: hypothetical protein WDZ29_06465 [Balneolaceae bacterium]
MKNNMLWLVSGLIGIAIATSLSFLFGSLWAGYFSAMTVAIMVLILMSNSMMKTIHSTGMKRTLLCLFGVLVIFQGYYSVLQWNRALFQKEILREVRLTIDGGIGQVESETLLIHTLKSYYLSENDSTLEEHFLKIADGKLQEDGSISIRSLQDENDLSLYYEIPSTDSIVIYASSAVALGDDPEFENRNGKAGRYESQAILTEKGVRYVRQN